jgi:cell division septation protein DedD
MDMSGLVAAMTPTNTPGSGPKPPVRAPEPTRAPEPRTGTSKPIVKPATVASAPATTASIPAPTGAGGAFSVQLAGTTSPAEAKDAVDRLTRRYASELGSYRPTVLKAEVGSKTVYRVRVKGLSSEDANTLCARLKAGGGPCFVARD